MDYKQMLKQQNKNITGERIRNNNDVIGRCMNRCDDLLSLVGMSSQDVLKNTIGYVKRSETIEREIDNLKLGEQ